MPTRCAIQHLWKDDVPVLEVLIGEAFRDVDTHGDQRAGSS